VEYTLTVNDREKYATYTRDNAGLDYAVNRYYSSQWGRFLSPDPSGWDSINTRSRRVRNLRIWLRSRGRLRRGSVDLRSPQSWNRYAYVGNDPANHSDPVGLDDADYGDDYGGDDSCPVVCFFGDDWGDGTLVESSFRAFPSQYYLEDGDIVIEPVVADRDALNSTAQAVFGMINELDPGQFIDIAGLAMGAAYIAPIGVAAAGGLAGGTMVLGSSGYVEIAGIVGGEALNIPTDVWEALGDTGQKQVMSEWINAAWNSGMQIVFTNNPALAAQNTGLAYEYEVITQKLGLQVVQSGTSWVVAAP
jgi:uncharacterized protein RhaS with RHS repeats